MNALVHLVPELVGGGMFVLYEKHDPAVQFRVANPHGGDIKPMPAGLYCSSGHP